MSPALTGFLTAGPPAKSRQHESLVLAYRDTVSIVGTQGSIKIQLQRCPLFSGPRTTPGKQGGLLGVILTPGELSIQLHNLVFQASRVRTFPTRLQMHDRPFHRSLYVPRAANSV